MWRWQERGSTRYCLTLRRCCVFFCCCHYLLIVVILRFQSVHAGFCHPKIKCKGDKRIDLEKARIKRWAFPVADVVEATEADQTIEKKKLNLQYINTEDDEKSSMVNDHMRELKNASSHAYAVEFDDRNLSSLQTEDKLHKKRTNTHLEKNSLRFSQNKEKLLVHDDEGDDDHKTIHVSREATTTTSYTNSSVTTVGPEFSTKRNKSHKEESHQRAFANSTTSRTTTTRSLWRKRNARSLEEGIRRERTNKKLSSVLTRAGNKLITTGKSYTARTISGLIHALAEEATGLEVELDARQDTPFWGKQVDTLNIKFSRLGFKPLRIGGLEKKASIRKTDENIDDGLLSCADEAFDRIDVDKSGALDPDELAEALNLAAIASVNNVSTNDDSIRNLALELVKLYDFNGDGVVDRDEYKSMVQDMAALSEQATKEEEDEIEKAKQQLLPDISSDVGGWVSSVGRTVQRILRFNNVADEEIGNNSTVTSSGGANKGDGSNNAADTSYLNGDNLVAFDDDAITRIKYNETAESSKERKRSKDLQSRDQQGNSNANSEELMDVTSELSTEAKVMGDRLGSIRFSDLKLDLRRLIFGAVPFLKRITPGGPLVLEPFTTTVTGAWNNQDIMDSFLLDAALRSLVARALRRRVGSLRDLFEGALFYGRSWKMFSDTGPSVEVPKLIDIEFDEEDRLIITGRARVRPRPNAAIIENAFKVRTSIGTRKGGRVIRLVDPELALVLECPRSFEQSIGDFFEFFRIKRPERPPPIYTFFPIYSPFKVDDNDGFDLGEDNCINNISIKDGALRFEFQAVIRPGRFLGSYYVAFSIPNRTFIVTLDRIKQGIRAAREAKRNLRLQRQRSRRQRDRRMRARRSIGSSNMEATSEYENNGDSELMTTTGSTNNMFKRPQRKTVFNRFVDGFWLPSEREGTEKKRVTSAIRDFFGRQAPGNNDDNATT